MFTQMQDGLTIALALSVLVFVLALFSEGRGHKILSWILAKTGRRSPVVVEPTTVTFMERHPAPVQAREPALPQRPVSAGLVYRAPRDRVNVEGAPALAHRDTREPEFTTHS